ncbi:hypothetical protein [Haloarcula sp. 1CSR25-25]|uniref:hypothetical protein n=1 Tax=Haloarcula sp. 1CSR25-25 TaxID=2862545 RepID=UPI002894D60E|nr:hypothetical protein [Haloarcula sp. 1CSR25-25]MDT3435973.1 hypothetical protein [Haloarcula sp. 1CSR25-25]
MSGEPNVGADGETGGAREADGHERAASRAEQGAIGTLRAKLTKFWADNEQLPRQYGPGAGRGELFERVVTFSVGLRDLQAELAKDGRQYDFSTTELVYDEDEPAVQYGHYAAMCQQNAQRALRGDDVVSFWRYLAEARQWELAAWQELRGSGSKPLQFRAQQVLMEATDALPDDRQERVEELLLEDEGVVKETVGFGEVYAAIHILHQQHIEEYRADRRLRALERQFVLFILSTLVAVGGILVSFGLMGVDATEVTSLPSLLTAVLFGVLGASVSGLLSLTDVLGAARVPERVGSNWLTVGRMVTGAAAALTLVVFLVAGILEQFIRIDSNLNTMFAVAFLGGFSERLLLRAVEAVVGDTE